MNCVFKSYGYVPQNHLCVGCSPLRQLLSIVGYDENQSKRGSRTILNAFNLINLADAIRDEGILHRTKARLLMLFRSRTLSVELKQILQDVNKESTLLEEKNTNTEAYLERMSRFGGEIFASLGGTPTQQMMLRDIGVRMAGAVIIDDMVKDRDRDIANESYNPLIESADMDRERITATYVNRFTKLVNPILGDNDYRTKGSITREWIEELCCDAFIGTCCI